MFTIYGIGSIAYNILLRTIASDEDLLNMTGIFPIIWSISNYEIIFYSTPFLIPA